MTAALKTRVLLTGLAVALVATGCSTVEEAVAEVTAKDELVRAAPGASSEPFDYDITGLDTDGTDQHLTGVASPAAKGYELRSSYRDPDLGFTMNMDLRVVAEQSWVKIVFEGTEGVEGLPELPEKWMALDAAKVTDESMPTSFAETDPDPGTSGQLLAGIITAAEGADGTYSGTLDLTKAPKAEITDLTAAGAAAASVPFTATIDGSGRLTLLTVDVPAAGPVKAFTYKVTYRYGSATAVEAPAADETAKTPESIYELLAA